MNRRDTILGALGLGAASLLGTGYSAEAQPLDIVAELGASAQHLTLVHLLVAADMIDDLRQPGPFTVFAPREEAFARISRARLESLGHPSNRATLARMLSYHVVPGRHSVFALMGRRTALTTLAGPRLVVDGLGNGLTAGRARIGLAEVDARNGLVHEIDRLLLPA